MTYRFLEHTADVGIEAEADSLESLFCECLRAQTDCVTQLSKVEEQLSRFLQMQAPDLSQLLVDFLSETIYLYETEGLVFASATLEVIEDKGTWSLSGVVSGEVFDLSRHGLRTLLKAVTYHQLMVQDSGESWIARVIFDI